MKKRAVLVASIVLTFLTLSSYLILSSSSASAEDVIDNIAITVPSACSFTSSTQDATFTRTLTNNHYESGIGTNTFTVACNDISGFSVYAIGYSNEEYGNTNMLPSVSGLPSIPTGTATSGNNSAWAMRLTPVTGTYAPTITSDTEGSFSNYHTVPSTYAKVATFTQIVDGSVGSSMTSDYAVFISSTQPAGTYTGKVKYTLVHPNDATAPEIPCSANQICYYPNATGVADNMENQTIADDATEANLWASNFQRQGYGFAGWTDNPDYILNSGNNATAGHIYGPNETIDDATTLANIQSDGLSLYAVWVPSAGNLQSWTGCSSLPQGNVTALTDQRDNQVYAVAKLADGVCWMIENLRLNTSGSNDQSKSQGFAGVFNGLADPETANFSNTNPPAANSLYYSGTQSGTATINIGTTNPSRRFPRYNNQNTTSPASNMTTWDNSQNVYSVGNYYTWSAALANTNDYTGPTAEVDGKTSETVNTSICPSGWRLPYGRNTGNGNTPGGFYYLNYKINNVQNITNATASNRLRAYPNNFIYSGYFGTSSPLLRGEMSIYMSSTASGSSNNYYSFSMFKTNINPGTNSALKHYGLSVRCIAGS